MLRKRVNNFLSLLSGYRSKWLVICLVFLLSACGDNCYEDENISDDGKTFYNKNYEHQVKGENAEWMNTGIDIEAGDGFTITNVQGQVSGCTNPNAVGSCAVFFATMCQDGKKYLCTDSECNNTKILNDCAGKSDCVQSDRCTGVTEKNKCVSGVLYNYDANNSKWVQQDGSCMESVFCDSVGNKMLNTSYQIGSAGSDIEYKNLSTKIGTCSTNEMTCDNGHAYPISAQKSDWTQIDSNIQPGDDIYLSIMEPKASSGTSIGPPGSNVANPSLNAWSKQSYVKKPGKNCPSSYPLSTSQSGYTSCGSIDNGYYTCPLCESASNHVPVSGDTSKKCDDPSGKTLLCWGVGGSGLWLKVIDDSENCSDSECTASDCIWFNQDTSSTSSSKFGDIYYIPANLDGNGCSEDITKCTNRITKRHITGPDGKTSKICAKISGDPGSYSDNAGGYTVYATRTTCIAKDGKPSPVASFWGKPGWLGLEYIVSSTTPLNSQYGIATPENVQYPHKITSPKSGKLYLRVRDDDYKDNTGYFDVMIQYHKYVTSGSISGVIESVKNLVRSMTFNAATQYFHNITCTGDACNCQSGNCKSQYVDYIRALLVLYIAGYGLSFIIGFVQITQFDLFMRILKVGLVMALISDGSFDFFYNNFFDLFFDGMDDLIRMSQSGFSSSSASQGDVFSFVDSMISLTVLSKSTWLKVVGLMFTTPYGLLLAVLLIVSIVIFLIGIFKAVVVYLVATLVLGVLMLLAPVFIPFVLFQTTRHLFENWIKMFAQYSLEPIILLIGLSFMTQLLYQLFSQIINFHVCWKCMWPINMPFIPSSTLDALGLSHTLFCLQFFGPFGLMPSGAALIPALGMEMADVVIVIILCHLILSYDSLVQQMVLRITGGEAAQFMASGNRQFSSAGSAATHMLSRVNVRGVSAAGLASGGKNYIAGSARRAALRIMGRKTEEEKLLSEAKKTDKKHREEIAERSTAFSSGMDEMMSTRASFEKKVLQDPNESKEVKSVAAEAAGRKLYESMGNKSEFKGLINNLSTLSSIDEGSKAHGELSDQAKKMRDILKGDNASSALSALSSKSSTTEEKQKATGKLLKEIHDKDPSLHAALHKDPLSESSKKLVEEINDLERKPRSSLRSVKDEEDELNAEDSSDKKNRPDVEDDSRVEDSGSDEDDGHDEDGRRNEGDNRDE